MKKLTTSSIIMIRKRIVTLRPNISPNFQVEQASERMKKWTGQDSEMSDM